MRTCQKCARYLPCPLTCLTAKLSPTYPLLSQKLAKYISAEYKRTSMIAHIHQPTTGTQEGWGRPGRLCIFTRSRGDSLLISRLCIMVLTRDRLRLTTLPHLSPTNDSPYNLISPTTLTPFFPRPIPSLLSSSDPLGSTVPSSHPSSRCESGLGALRSLVGKGHV